MIKALGKIFQTRTNHQPYKNQKAEGDQGYVNPQLDHTHH